MKWLTFDRALTKVSSLSHIILMTSWRINCQINIHFALLTFNLIKKSLYTQQFDKVIKSNLNHQENIISNIWAVFESEIRSSIINTRNIILVWESVRKHIYCFSSIHFTLQYFRWIQYQFFKISHRKLRHQKFNHYIKNFRSNFHFSIELESSICFENLSEFYLFC